MSRDLTIQVKVDELDRNGRFLVEHLLEKAARPVIQGGIATFRVGWSAVLLQDDLPWQQRVRLFGIHGQPPPDEEWIERVVGMYGDDFHQTRCWKPRILRGWRRMSPIRFTNAVGRDLRAFCAQGRFHPALDPQSPDAIAAVAALWPIPRSDDD
jgi:hypothetical protein